MYQDKTGQTPERSEESRFDSGVGKHGMQRRGNLKRVEGSSNGKRPLQNTQRPD